MGDSRDSVDDIPSEAATEQEPTAAELEAAGQGSMFGADVAPIAPTTETTATSLSPSPTSAESGASHNAQAYRVLARKYRPQKFSELIGQEPMIQTLSNAIKRNRLAHAFLMTGVRGVGKTSTARLIAKSLNCIGVDGTGGPTIDACGRCEPCLAIAEGRHMDVIEMDAASHTGVDDVREIIEAVRYAAVSARYKIYIIDEVHMLSKAAFNALLKTLEEPPAHVKFLFATTEVNKLPVTVLSRTQRFDLRRISTPLLQSHFASVCKQEGVAAEDEALHMIAVAAEGSVRDGLSILDQAIAHADLDGEGIVSAAKVQDMLGLADKGAQRRVLSHILAGDGAALLHAIDDQYALGIEPIGLMRAVMDVVHRITLTQVTGTSYDAPSAEEQDALAGWAKQLTTGQLHRLWQLLLKGFEEVRHAPDPLASLKMALLRVLHAADLPDPGKLAKMIELAANSGFHAAPNGQAAPAQGDGAAPQNVSAGVATALHADQSARLWRELVDKVDASGELLTAQIMRDWVQVEKLAPGHLVYAAQGYSEDPSHAIRSALSQVTGEKWVVEKIAHSASLSLRVQAEQVKAQADAEMRAHPLVAAVMSAFPAAVISDDNHAASTPQSLSRSA